MRGTSVILVRFIGPAAIFLTGIAAIIGSGGGGNDFGIYPFWVETDAAVADMNRDGRNEIVTLAMYAPGESVREGHIDLYGRDGQGKFLPPTSWVLGEYPWHLTLSDIDGDEFPDMLVTDVDRNEIWLVRQNEESIGQFLQPQLLAAGWKAYTAAAADFNNDGAVDLAFSDNSSGSHRSILFYQNPAVPGSFIPAKNLNLPGSSAYVTAGDLDGDGLADLLVWLFLEPEDGTQLGELAVSFQQPDGTLGPVEVVTRQKGLQVEYLAIADYEGDGANDIFALFTSAGGAPRLSVLLQDRAKPGTFTGPVETSLSGIIGLSDGTVADLDNDGRPDFAVLSQIYSRLYLFTSSGGGNFLQTGVYSIPISMTSRLTAGDIDGDDLNDLIVLGGDNKVMVLLQSQTTAGVFDPPASL